MIRFLLGVRLSRLALAAVATLSALATALIIASALGRTGLQSAVIAALQRRVVVHTHPDARAAPAPISAPGGSSTAAGANSAGASSSPSSADTGAATTDTTAGAGTTDTTATTDMATSTTSTTSTTTSSTTTAVAKKTDKVKHVFVIALSTTSYRAAFGRSSVAHYLNGTLKPKGTLLSGYHTLGNAELPDYLALISGQAPNADTRAECGTYAEFPASAKPAANGQVPGNGCVYPNTVLTIGDQVTASGSVWKAYLGDMGKATCVHPNSGARDDVALPFAGAQYDTRHNPFIYFHSLLDLGDCSADDATLDGLPADLHAVSTTPRYAYIAPGVCEDASSPACPAGLPGGLAAEDAFLRLWVPRILASAAYRRDGALMLVFAAVPPPAGKPASGPVRTGVLILSRFAMAGRSISAAYGPYSVLRSVEDVLGYAPLAHAATAKSFAAQALPDA